jgi:hypothetical protein
MTGTGLDWSSASWAVSKMDQTANVKQRDLGGMRLEFVEGEPGKFNYHKHLGNNFLQ